jgi:hypothetical protein
MNASMVQFQMMSFLYFTLNEKYQNIMDVCYKLGNYEYLYPFLEQASKVYNSDVKLMYKIFNERNPLYPDVPSIKEMVEINRSQMKKIITKGDIDIIMKSKDDIISSMTNVIKSYEESLPKLMSANLEYQVCIENLKTEIQKKKLQISALNKDNFFSPGIKTKLTIEETKDISSPNGIIPSSGSLSSGFSSSSLNFWNEPSLTF